MKTLTEATQDVSNDVQKLLERITADNYILKDNPLIHKLAASHFLLRGLLSKDMRNIRKLTKQEVLEETTFRS